MKLSPLTRDHPNFEADYTLNTDSVWITVGNLSVYIVDTGLFPGEFPKGVVIEVFPLGKAMEPPIAELHASEPLRKELV